MRMIRMEVGGTPFTKPFTKPVEFELDEQVNLFVGPNATGKTTLLQQVLEKFHESATGSELGLSGINEQFAYLLHGYQCTFALDDDDDPDDISQFTKLTWNIINVPATRVPYKALPREDGLATNVERPQFKGSAADSEIDHYYGVEDFSQTLYEDYINNAVSALYHTIKDGPDYDAFPILHPGILEKIAHNPDASKSFSRAMQRAHDCAREICREVVLGASPLNEHTLEEVESEDGLPDLKPHSELAVRVLTRDVGVPSLNMQSLSAGTAGTFWWIKLVAISLLLMHNFNPGWEKRRAPLLIDEIENHLHPTWQRRVIPALLKYFPGLQIFATTHSPFVVAGRKAGQVHLLEWHEDGITASTNTKDIVGWTMDEILRAFMGVNDPTDERTANAARELRELRDEGRRADELDEEKRQARMQELRMMVNRDLLAGGPKAAARELFEKQFAEALEKYRKSQELNQDSG